jgi:ferredoxin
MGTKIRASREKCVGAGTCVTLAPSVFDQSEDDSIVILLKEEVAEGEYAAVAEAIDFCPAQALWFEGGAE